MSCTAGRLSAPPVPPAAGREGRGCLRPGGDGAGAGAGERGEEAMTRDGTRVEQTVLIIRHAEKPEPPWGAGVGQGGRPDEKSLAPRGWQRAGAWAELFVPSLGGASSLPRPTRIVASGHVKHVTGEQGGHGRRTPRACAPGCPSRPSYRRCRAWRRYP